VTTLLFPNLSPQASAFLLGVGSGEYDAALAGIDQALTLAGTLLPQALLAKEILDGLVALNKATAPLHVQPDGQGGYVPTTNSRVMPDGSLRSYDPQLDG